MAEDKPLFPLGQAPQPQAFLGTDREGSPQTQSRVSHLHGSEAGFLTKFQSRGENLLLSSLSPTSSPLPSAFHSEFSTGFIVFHCHSESSGGARLW